MGGQFHFHPDTYLDLVLAEVPAYVQLQDAVAESAAGLSAHSILELGTGTGETTRRLLALHPAAGLIGVDESAAMLDHARRVVPQVDLRVGRIEDPLPSGSFDLIAAALVVHHLDGAGKSDLFRRVAAALAEGGRFVMGDVVVPEDPDDVVTPIDGDHDRPSSVADQLAWLAQAGLRARVVWSDRDLAVIVADKPSAGDSKR